MLLQEMLNKKINFEKRYSVYLEKFPTNMDGYKYYSLEFAPLANNRRNFILIYHFKKAEKSINPLMIIDSLAGDDFDEKISIVNHFKKNYALTFAVSMDGFNELIKRM